MPNTQQELKSRLKWLISMRAFFGLLLFGSTLIFHLQSDHFLPIEGPFIVIYALTAFIFFLTLLYSLLHRLNLFTPLLTYTQIIIDTGIVTLIIFATGSFFSIFSFLYIIVVMYSSMYLLSRGILFITTLCTLQYGLMIIFEYIGFIEPINTDLRAYSGLQLSYNFLLYKLITNALTYYAIAIISGLLAEKEKKARKELHAMKEHIKRVDNLAAIGEMAAGLAHEIKNPLASLSGSLQMLKEETPCEPHHEKLIQISLREADRLSALVSDFLLFAKPQKGIAVPIEISTTLSEIIVMLKKDKSYKHTTIETRLLPNVWIEMDENQFRQVMWNILLNALEAIPPENGIIQIKSILTSYEQLKISIRDNGMGIPREDLNSIFLPFFTTKSNGTGLGLFIAYRIMGSYNNRIDIDSTPGAGTKITLYFRRIPPPKV